MRNTSEIIIERIKNSNGRYWAGDNISQYLEPGDAEALIEELTEELEKNKKSLTRELETMVADQLTGIEIYANMPEWQIELFETIKAPTNKQEFTEQDEPEEES